MARTNASANVEIKGALPRACAPARAISPAIHGGATASNRLCRAFAVGVGIMPKFNTGDKALDKRASSPGRNGPSALRREGQLDHRRPARARDGCVIESGEVLARMCRSSLAPPNRRGAARGAVA
jgi:hypothetical protein